jgi:hypothetical protein
MDIVERLRDMNPLTTIACSGEAADTIESLRQQLATFKNAYAEQVDLHNLTLDELAECQARCDERHNPWQDALINELVAIHIYDKKHDDDPAESLSDIIEWHTAVAMNQRLSSAASELARRAKREALLEVLELNPDAELASVLRRMAKEMK